MSFNEILKSFNDILGSINDVMYTYVLIILLLEVGIYFTIRTRGVQFRLLKDGIKSMLEKGGEDKDGKKKVSSFQALMISTASRTYRRQSVPMWATGAFTSLPFPSLPLPSAA